MRQIYKTVSILSLLSLCHLSMSATIDNLMPTPKEVRSDGQASFKTGRNVRLTDPTKSKELLRFMDESGLNETESGEAVISVSIKDVDGLYDYPLYGFPAEGYKLKISADTILIEAPDQMGVTRAAQTLSQLAEGCDGKIDGVEITDWPAFKLRGFMHDVGRSFLPIEELKREIDLLSRFKVNTFHWHLTDNTGWRMEIKAFDQLTGDKSIIRYPGEYYTQAEAKELQDYAAERGVTIIPEIDMPGHSGPFERSMGYSMQSDEGKDALKIVLNEVVEVFDKSPYIHIGGDEIGFKDDYLIEMIDYVHSLGKKVVIWNQYNMPPKPVNPEVIPCDMTTNWATIGRLSRGVPNVDMRYNYTNHFDVFADVVGIYKSSIFGQERGDEDVAGTISAAWNDTKVPTHSDIVNQNNIYANILASAERAWKGGGKQYIEDGGTTLPLEGDEYEEFADWERRFLHHKATTLAETADLIPYVRQTDVVWNLTDQIPNGGDPDIELLPERFLSAEMMPESFNVDGNIYGINKVRGAGVYLRHIWHPIVKGYYEEPDDSVTAYAWTYVYSPVDQDAGALIEFYTYSRSGDEKGPKEGQWDRRGSKIWLNGMEISAPLWQQPDAEIKQDHTENGLTNENMTNRPPVAIHLNKGWNKVFMKLPHANNGGTKRDKWQFTFVITDADGREALDGILYSPNRKLSE